MKQFFKIVNLSKKEYISPLAFNNDMSIFGFTLNAVGTASALAILLADGGTDTIINIENPSPIIGRWAGDRIVIAGELAEDGDWMKNNEAQMNLYQLCTAPGVAKDISLEVLDVLLDDESFYQPFIEQWQKSDISRTYNTAGGIEVLLKGKSYYDMYSNKKKFVTPPMQAAMKSLLSATWPVKSSTGSTVYNVSKDMNDKWSCSCPNHIYRRHDCKHIKQIKQNLTP